VSLGAPALLALAAVGIAGLFGLGGRLWRAARRRSPAHPAGHPAQLGRSLTRPSPRGGALVRLLQVGGAGLAALAGATLLGGALAADGRSLGWHFVDPHFSKENVRAAAEFIAPRAAPDDLLIGAPGRL